MERFLFYKEEDIVSSLWKHKAVFKNGYSVVNYIEDKWNLVENPDNMNIILKQNNKKIKKDKFSALIYGLYWCKMEEDKGNRKKRNLADYAFYTPMGKK